MQLLFAALVFLIIILIFAAVYRVQGGTERRGDYSGPPRGYREGHDIRQECPGPGV